MKVCPSCAEEIQDAAIKCRHCQSSLLPPEQSAAVTWDTTSPASVASPPPGAATAAYWVASGLNWIIALGCLVNLANVPHGPDAAAMRALWGFVGLLQGALAFGFQRLQPVARKVAIVFLCLGLPQVFRREPGMSPESNLALVCLWAAYMAALVASKAKFVPAANNTPAGRSSVRWPTVTSWALIAGVLLVGGLVYLATTRSPR